MDRHNLNCGVPHGYSYLSKGSAHVTCTHAHARVVHHHRQCTRKPAVLPAGTPEYVAPEVLARESYNGKAADVWSCGVVLYTLLTGTFPFRDPEEQRLSQVALLQRLFPRILTGQFDMPTTVSKECQSLLRAMLTVDPLRRIPAAHILQHPWMKKFDAAKELAQLQKAARKPVAKGWSMQTDQEIMLLSTEAAKCSSQPQESLPY